MQRNSKNHLHNRCSFVIDVDVNSEKNSPTIANNIVVLTESYIPRIPPKRLPNFKQIRRVMFALTVSFGFTNLKLILNDESSDETAGVMMTFLSSFSSLAVCYELNLICLEI